jgi:hypothetical protein
LVLGIVADDFKEEVAVLARVNAYSTTPALGRHVIGRSADNELRDLVSVNIPEPRNEVAELLRGLVADETVDLVPVDSRIDHCVAGSAFVDPPGPAERTHDDISVPVSIDVTDTIDGNAESVAIHVPCPGVDERSVAS